MQPFKYSTKVGKITIREASRTDIPQLLELYEQSYPFLKEEDELWREDHMFSHQRIFPEGQQVAEYKGQIIGACSSLIVDMGSDPLRTHTYAGITDDDYFYNHDDEGDTLYGADVTVHPDYRRSGVARALYEGRRRLCQKLNLRRILAGGRIIDYCRHCNEMTADEYVERVRQEELVDSVLSFQLSEGFELRGVLPNYLFDPRSKNYAALIEWLNPDYSPPATFDPKVRVACVQYHMRQVEDFEDFAGQVRYFVETAADDYESDFVVFPEFFSVQLLSAMNVLTPLEGIKRLSEMKDDVVELLSGLAKQFGIYIIGGSHPVQEEGGQMRNKSLIVLPDGSCVEQPKLHITPSERTSWGIEGGDELFVIQTPKVKFAVQICYDIEFPEASRYLADQGADIIFVPYCTDNRQGHLRVRYCSQARAIENQIYVVTAGVVGNLPSVPAMDIHYGQAAVYTPSDFEFARDGIQAQADPNVETMLVTDLDVADLYRSHSEGAVTPLTDRRRDLFEIKATLRSRFIEDDVQRFTPMRRRPRISPPDAKHVQPSNHQAGQSKG